jgi:protein O-mannosyl-transferase
VTEAKQKLNAGAGTPGAPASVPAGAPEPNRRPDPGGAAESGLGALLAQPIMACLLLAAVTLVVYWPVQSCDYISLDDPLFITRNPYVQAPFSWDGLVQALAARTGGIWQPVTTLTYLLDAALFGRDPTGPHIINLLWHVASSVILFLWLREMTRAHWRSLGVAALFALHPLHVESVAWLAERKDVVSTCFGLLALWAYARYAARVREQTGAGPAPPGLAARWAAPLTRRYYLLALLCFVLGLLSKPMLVTLPCLFLLLDYWPLQRLAWAERPTLRVLRPLVLEKLPFFLLSGLACLVAVWAQQEGGALQPLDNSPLPLRLENALVAYARYLGKLVWPVDLAVPYPAAPHWPWVIVAYAAALLAGLSALALWRAPRRPFALMGWLWFVGTLVPVIGVVQVGDQALADRYTYLPSVGLFVVLSWGAGALLAWKPALRTAAAALAIVGVGACALLTRNQLGYWRDSETLFTHTLAVTEDNWLASFSLGMHYSDKHRTDEAIVQFQRALKLQPESTAVLSNLGVALAEAGHTDEALRYFDRALQLRPRAPATHYRLANALARVGRLEEAIAHYRLALQYEPHYPEALNNLAVALFNRGQLDEALQQFHKALALLPNDASTHCNLGNLLAAQHRWVEAGEQYAEAARLQPELLDAHYGLARVLLQIGRRDDAVEQLQAVLQLNPAHAGAQKLLQALQTPAAK